MIRRSLHLRRKTRKTTRFIGDKSQPRHWMIHHESFPYCGVGGLGGGGGGRGSSQMSHPGDLVQVSKRLFKESCEASVYQVVCPRKCQAGECTWDERGGSDQHPSSEQSRRLRRCSHQAKEVSRSRRNPVPWRGHTCRIDQSQGIFRHAPPSPSTPFHPLPPPARASVLSRRTVPLSLACQVAKADAVSIPPPSGQRAMPSRPTSRAARSRSETACAGCRARRTRT